MIFWIIIVLLMLIVGAFAKEMRKHRICPSCSRRGLRCIRVVPPADAVDARSRLENSVSYYHCKFCGKNFKRRFPNKPFEQPTAEELANYSAGKFQKP